MSVTVTYGGFTFRGGSETGAGWFLNDEGLVGWSDGVDNRYEDTPRPMGHGSYGTAALFKQSRVVTVSGQYVGVSVAEAKAARLAMAALGASAVRSPFTVLDDDLGFPLTASASVVGAPKMPEQVLYPFFIFSFDVVATDPRRYGPTVTAANGLPTSGTGMVFPAVFPADFGTPGDPGQVTLINTGTADTYPLLAVSGQLDGGFSIVEVATGRETRFERVVPAGSVVYVDTRTGRAYIDQPGSDVSGFLTRTDYPTVPAMSSRTLQFASIGTSSGAPQLVASWASAWW